MPTVKATKKFVGVYYSESKQRKWKERPDKCYYVGFKEVKSGKLRWERCGWISEGWTPEAAQRRRHQLLEQDRAGEYKPKQERKTDQLTFGELMEKNYLPWAKENKKAYSSDFIRYHKWLKPRYAERTLNRITPFDLERLKKDMRDKDRSDATVKHVLCIVRQAFNKAIVWNLWKGDNPCKGVSFPKLDNARQRFLTHEEAEKILNALRERNPQIGGIATFSLYGGLRLGEVFNITWSNVDRTHDIIHVFDTKHGSRPIFITNPIREVLDEIKRGKPEDKIFETNQVDPVTWASKIFKEVADELNLNAGVSDRRERITFHTLRHTYASWAVGAGVPLYVVGKALGHKTTVMTQRYSHLAPESHRAAFEAVARVAAATTEEKAQSN